jgi:hypothetical protein
MLIKVWSTLKMPFWDAKMLRQVITVEDNLQESETWFDQTRSKFSRRSLDAI